jgi:hypothetical protein
MFQMIGIWISLLFMHPLHLGVIHLNVNEQNEAEIEVRLFTDDLEAAIMHQYGKPFKTVYSDEESVNRVLDYLGQKMRLYENQKPLVLKCTEIKPQKDVTVISCKTTIKEKNSLKICCEVFFELFRDQTNLIILKTNDIEEGYRLDQSKACVSVED